MSDDKRSLRGIHALLTASELIKSGVTSKNWVKTEPVKQEQKIVVERKSETSSIDDLGRKSDQSIGQFVSNRQSVPPDYTCVRIRFHRIPSPRPQSNKRERAQQEEDAPLSQYNNEHLLSQKISEFKQQKRSRTERRIDMMTPNHLVPSKTGEGGRFESPPQRTGGNRSNVLNLANHQAVKVRARDICMENYEPKALVELLSYTRLSYQIFKSSYYPQQHNEDTFYAHLMCSLNEEPFECEINWADSSNITVLMLACTQSDNVQMIRDLLSSGANPYAFDVLGRSPLHYAAESGMLEVIKLLVLCAKVPVDIRSPGLSWTPLLAAVVSKRWQSVKLLSALAIATKPKPK